MPNDKLYIQLRKQPELGIESYENAPVLSKAQFDPMQVAYTFECHKAFRKVHWSTKTIKTNILASDGKLKQNQYAHPSSSDSTVFA